MNDDFVTTAGDGGLIALIGGAFWLFFIGLYLFFGWLFYRIACNAGQRENAWWAFVPILNIFLIIKAAQKPLWWFLLMLVPIINLAVFAVLMWQVAERCGKSGLWGLLSLVPLVNVVAMFVLAFATPPRLSQPMRTAPRVRESIPTR